MEDEALEAFREVNLSDGKCNVSLYVCAEEEKKIDEDPDYAGELFKAALEGRLPAACDDSENGGGSDIATEDTVKKEPRKKISDIEWDKEATRVLISAIENNFQLLPVVNNNRRKLVSKLQQELLDIGWAVSLENVKQKLNSLLTTYKRIQFKASRVGHVKTRWEFYEVFDAIMKKAEGIRPKNGTLAEMKTPNIEEVKVEPDFLDMDTLLEDDVPGNFCSTPALAHSGSSDLVSREASPEGFSKETDFVEESSTEQHSPPKKKRKVSEMSGSSPAKSPSKKNSQASSSKTKESPVSRVSPTLNQEDSSDDSLGGTEHVVISCEGSGFNRAATLLFIDCIKKHKEKLKMKKSGELFAEIRKEMLSEGFSFTEEKLRKKWYNLLVSYRRILERANETGDIVSDWPFYEAVDNIIADTKVVAQNTKDSSYPYGASTSKGQLLQENERVGMLPNDNSNIIPRGHDSKSVLDALQRSDDCDSEFQRNFMEEWEQREIRREERDMLKLELLQKIAKSMEAMTQQQDTLINILKKS